MDSAHDPGFEERLAQLRSRLKSARAERGGCPPWEELRADLLPGGKNRPGRTDRLAHRAICPYCDTHVREGAQSFEHTADTLEAVERGVVQGLAGGARQLVRRLAQPRAAAGPPAPAPDAAPAPNPPPPAAPVPTYLATPAPTPARPRQGAVPSPAT